MLGCLERESVVLKPARSGYGERVQLQLEHS